MRQGWERETLISDWWDKRYLTNADFFHVCLSTLLVQSFFLVLCEMVRHWRKPICAPSHFLVISHLSQNLLVRFSFVRDFARSFCGGGGEEEGSWGMVVGLLLIGVFICVIVIWTVSLGLCHFSWSDLWYCVGILCVCVCTLACALAYVFVSVCVKKKKISPCTLMCKRKCAVCDLPNIFFYFLCGWSLPVDLKVSLWSWCWLHTNHYMYFLGWKCM